MGRVVLDSSVLIAMFYDGDIHSKSVVKKLEEEVHSYLISTISLAETLIQAYRVSFEEGERIMGRILYAIPEVIVVDAIVASEAARIRAKTGMKIADSIISATATLNEAQLWTLDRKQAKAHKGAILIA